MCDNKECNKDCDIQVRHFWVKNQLPSKLCTNSIYFVKVSSGVLMYVTSITGVPSLIGSTAEGEVSIVSPDSSITIEQDGQNFEISISDTLQSLIESALQPGDNVSALENDAGYITDEDLGDFIPLSGTEVNKPVTGDIEFNTTTATPFLKINQFDWKSGVKFSDDKGVVFQDEYDSAEYNELYFSKNNTEKGSLIISSDFTTSKGIVGKRIFDKQDDLKAYIQLNDLQNGYIPLSGTLVDNPITGDIQFYNENDDTNAFIKYKSDLGNFIFGNDTFYNHPGGFYINDGFDNSFSTGFETGKFTVQSTNPNFKGIVGNIEFNYDGDRKAYVQKGYVDDAIATGGGAYIPLTQKGAANGVVPLNSISKIDSLYLPSYVDDVLEFANLAAFPVTGETGKIYVALNTNKTYRWSGSAYVEISASDVNSVAGLTGVISSAGLRTALSINNVDNTSDVNKPISTSTQTALNTKITQNGDSFGTSMIIGTNDNQNLVLERNNLPYISMMSGDIIQLRDDMTVYGVAGPTFSSLKMGNASGTNSISVRRNRPDTVTTFAVDNQNASSTGNIADFLSNSISVANFNKTGQLTIPNATVDTQAVTLGQLSSNSLSSLTTLTLATISRIMYYTYTGSTTSTWTLPSIATSIKVRYVLINTGSATVTINSNAGANDIWDSGTLSNTTVLTAGSSMELFNNGNSFIIL